jgi:HEAT repeat protein
VLALVLLGEAGAAPAPPVRREGQRSLRDRFGADAAKGLLRSEASETRRRGFARLGSVGTPRALELLARALDADGTARDARERLAVVRALAPHARDPSAEEALIRALGGVEGRAEERDLLVERTAALALAKARTPSGLRALSRALRQPGRASEHARLALSAHRPPSIEPVLAAGGLPTPALVALLGELRDARGLALLEKAMLDGAPPLRAEAALALRALDPPRAVAFARANFERETARELRLALARVLADARDEAAPRALGSLLADATTRSSALDIALDAPSPALGPVLAKASAPDETDRFFAALGRAGGPEALARLERALSAPADAWSALYALALASDSDADAVLERALARAPLRRDALRAAALRTVAQGRTPSGTAEALAALSRGDAADRASASFYRAVTEPEGASAAFKSRDPVEVRAAARASTEPALAAAAAQRLASETDPSLRAALASALASPSAADLVPTATLVALLEGRGAASYLAAYALSLRDSESVRPRLRELLESADPLLRSHVALGLAASQEASAVGLLGDTYRLEVEPSVRRAIVRALAERRETAREETLGLAAAFEPDTDARNRARRALAREASPLPPPSGTLWLRLGPGTGEPVLAVVEGPLGLALPFAPDPDGSVTVARLPAGDVSLLLAPAAPGRIPRGAGP